MTRWLPLAGILTFCVLIVVFPPAAWIVFLGGIGAAAFSGDVHG